MAMSDGIVIAAGQEGKYKTIIQIAAISFLLLHYKYRVDFLAFEVDVDANVVGTWLLYLSVAFSLWSAWVYIRDFFGAVYAPVEKGAKEAGKMRLEGKEYVVQDGDVVHFLFNV